MEEGLRSSAILMGLVCAVARGVLRGVAVVVVAVFCWGTTGGGVGIMQF